MICVIKYIHSSDPIGERRARERRAEVEETEAGIAPEEAVVLLLAEIAAKAGIEECEIGNPMSEEDLDEPSESSAVAVAKACDEFKCQIHRSVSLKNQNYIIR
jgi:hypothetical protein